MWIFPFDRTNDSDIHIALCTLSNILIQIIRLPNIPPAVMPTYACPLPDITHPEMAFQAVIWISSSSPGRNFILHSQLFKAGNTVNR